jgi:XRE family transcriptional regulator, regulator of sulfur utilization
MPSAPEIGRAIRRRRQEGGVTLEALATASGVSVAMLSEVERSVKNPTVRLAWQIARALDCSLTDLLEEPPAPPTTFVPAAQRRTLEDPETGVVRHGLITALLQGGLEVVSYEIPAGSTTGEMWPNRPGVLEHVVGIGGSLTLRVGEQRLQVERGDHVTYAPQTVVEYRNDGREPAEFLLLSDSSRSRRGRG